MHNLKLYTRRDYNFYEAAIIQKLGINEKMKKKKTFIH